MLNVSSPLNVCESIISVTIQSIVVAGAVTLIKFNSSPTFNPLTNSAFSQYINELKSMLERKNYKLHYFKVYGDEALVNFIPKNN